MTNISKQLSKNKTSLLIGIMAITAFLIYEVITQEYLEITPQSTVSNEIKCGAGQYMDMDTKTCLLKSSIQPEVIFQEKIVEKIITETTPMKVIRGINDKQNIFIVDNGENPTVFLQHCNGVTVLNNSVMTFEGDGSFILSDSTAGMTIFVDKRSAHQYQITTVPYTGETLNTVGTELMRSDMFKLKCEKDVVKERTNRGGFDYDIQLTSRDTVLRIDGDVGNIVKDKRNITGMIVLYQNGRIQDHMESFTINLSSNGEFSERIDVDGRSDSGKEWRDNKTYRVLISYDGKQITKDFRK